MFYRNCRTARKHMQTYEAHCHIAPRYAQALYLVCTVTHQTAHILWKGLSYQTWTSMYAAGRLPHCRYKINISTTHGHVARGNSYILVDPLEGVGTNSSPLAWPTGLPVG